MGRLIGIIARQPVDITFSIGKPDHIMASTHGWGAAWYEKKKLYIKKGVRSTLYPELNQPVNITVTTHMFLLHLRQATSGNISEQNTHPFTYDDFAFAHIGSVNKDLLYQKLSTPFNKDFQSEPIDSEVYFRLIMQEMKNNTLSDAIKNVVSKVSTYKGANFIMTNNDALYAYRFGHEMYWSRWNKNEPFSLKTQSGILLSSKGLSSTQAYIIASDKLFENSWMALDEGELFMVEKSLQYESVKLVLSS